MTRMTMRRLLAATALAGLTWPALAQSGPPLPSMPMPPSASDPAPRDTSIKPKVRKPTARPRKSTDAANPDGSPARPATRARKPATAASSQSYERPSRYVPEEFDRGAGSDGSSVKPFVSETGRPGMGMRF